MHEYSGHVPQYWRYVRESTVVPSPRPCPWPVAHALPALGPNLALAMPLGSGPLAPARPYGYAMPMALARRSVNGAAFQRRWVRSAGRPGIPHVYSRRNPRHRARRVSCDQERVANRGR